MPGNVPEPPSEADDQSPIEPTPATGVSATNALTIADMFHAAGYATAHLGKWQFLAPVSGHRPPDHGFDYSSGFMGGCIDNYCTFFIGLARTFTTYGKTATAFAFP